MTSLTFGKGILHNGDKLLGVTPDSLVSSPDYYKWRILCNTFLRTFNKNIRKNK